MKQAEVDVYEVQPHELMVGLIEVIRETEKQIGYYEMKKMTKEHLDKNSKPIFRKKSQKPHHVLSYCAGSKVIHKSDDERNDTSLACSFKISI